MKYKRYEKYKDSGVEWIGKIPGHWDVVPLKFVVSTPITDGPHETPQLYDEGIPFVSAEACSSGTIDFSKIRGYISLEDHKFYSRKYKPQKNDIFMIKSGATTGITAIVETEEEFNIWSPLAVIRASSDYNPYYVLYSMRSESFMDSVVLHWSYGTQQNIGMGVIANLPIARPSLVEQKEIAEFLKGKTSEIDDLIADKERLIELLQEQRQAIITEAVTKGLNPNVKMKNSGIEWIGEIPEHWEVILIKRMANKITDGAHISPETEEGEYPFVSVIDIKDGNIDFANCLKTSHDSYQYMKNTGCQPCFGDILLSKDGTIGRTAVVTESRDFVVASSLIIITPNFKKLDSYYLNYWLQSDLNLYQMFRFVRGSALQRISITNLNKLFGVFPPLEEQHQIVNFLNYRLDEIDTLLKDLRLAITSLQGYRQSLISEAVTGKIDVRGYSA